VVAGEIVKGPSAAFLAAYGQPASTVGVLAFYERVAPGLLNGVVTDEAASEMPGGLRLLQLDTLMSAPLQRARVARHTLEFALSLVH